MPVGAAAPSVFYRGTHRSACLFPFHRWGGAAAAIECRHVVSGFAVLTWLRIAGTSDVNSGVVKVIGSLLSAGPRCLPHKIFLFEQYFVQTGQNFSFQHFVAGGPSQAGWGEPPIDAKELVALFHMGAMFPTPPPPHRLYSRSAAVAPHVSDMAPAALPHRRTARCALRCAFPVCTPAIAICLQAAPSRPKGFSQQFQPAACFQPWSEPFCFTSMDAGVF